LLVLVGAVGLVLMMAWANVANLLLARASAREKDVAVRVALGASRAAIVRLFLLETLPLALAGGALGLAITASGVGMLRRLMPATVPGGATVGINSDVLLFTAALSLGTCILVALIPALRASRPDVGGRLQDSARTAGDRGGIRLRKLIVTSEVALATLLLITAGLLIESFRQLSHVDPGFKTGGIITMQISLPQVSYAEPTLVAAFYRQVLQRVNALPRVRHAGLVNRLPLSGQGSSGPATAEKSDGTVHELRDVGWRGTSPGYFRAMGIPLVNGREFLDTDIFDRPGVVIVDDLIARAFWPNQDPIGQRLKLGLTDWKAPWLTVVGVVRHVRHTALDSDTVMQLYWPYEQRPEHLMTLVAQADVDVDPQSLVSELRSQVFAVDRNQPVSAVATMERVLSDSLAARRFTVLLVGLFAALAVVLAALGIYGVMAYVVTLRTREIGIRMALGARPTNVLTGVMRDVVLLTITGLGVGLVCAAFTQRLLVGMLYGVSGADPRVTTVVMLLLLAAATSGGLIPALRAARTSAIVALRSE
jgi:predicted permease